MFSHTSIYTESEIRQLDFFCQIALEYRHVRFSKNKFAGALSRVEINYAEIAAEQQREGVEQADVFYLKHPAKSRSPEIRMAQWPKTPC